MSHQHVIEQYIKACSTADAEAAAACFTDDCVFEDLALQETLTGPEAVRALFASVFAAVTDFTITPVGTLVVDGDRVCTEWRMTGVHTGDFPGMPATGKSFDVPGLTIDEFRGDLIHRHRDYWNLAALLQQIGLMPAD